MILDTDAVPGCTNVALHKFSNYPSLFFEPKSTQFAYSVSLYKNEQIQVCGFCVFSFKKPLCFLTRGTMMSLKVSGATFF